MVSHNVSEGNQPRNMSKLHWAKGFSIWKPVVLHAIRASVSAMCRGRSPWRVIRRFTAELERAMSFSKEAFTKLKRQGGGMAAWQSDRFIVEE